MASVNQIATEAVERLSEAYDDLNTEKVKLEEKLAVAEGQNENMSEQIATLEAKVKDLEAQLSSADKTE